MTKQEAIEKVIIFSKDNNLNVKELKAFRFDGGWEVSEDQGLIDDGSLVVGGRFFLISDNGHIEIARYNYRKVSRAQ